MAFRPASSACGGSSALATTSVACARSRRLAGRSERPGGTQGALVSPSMACGSSPVLSSVLSLSSQTAFASSAASCFAGVVTSSLGTCAGAAGAAASGCSFDLGGASSPDGSDLPSSGLGLATLPVSTLGALGALGSGSAGCSGCAGCAGAAPWLAGELLAAGQPYFLFHSSSSASQSSSRYLAAMGSRAAPTIGSLGTAGRACDSICRGVNFTAPGLKGLCSPTPT
mmetsp:Transcript_134592/g.319040  ORF Transcript_134592/g.319040 Transcript_134592/m.319040 type:complete len:227 (+) Transcript_134592:1295-1975(+)